MCPLLSNALVRKNKCLFFQSVFEYKRFHLSEALECRLFQQSVRVKCVDSFQSTTTSETEKRSDCGRTFYCVTVTYIIIQIYQTVEMISTTTDGCIFHVWICTFTLYFHTASFIFHVKPAKRHNGPRHLLQLQIFYTLHILIIIYFFSG